MLQIQYRDKEEEVRIGSLFDELGYDGNDLVENKNEWPIEVLSFDGFYAIEGFRTVKPQSTIRVTTECGKILEGAKDHIVMTHDGWQKLRDLQPGNKMISYNTSPVVKTLEAISEKKKLYDFQVEICHSFMTNDLLSHNSHWLVALGANAMRAGKNVLHYTFELSETAVGIRYDSNLCHIASNDVQDHKDLVKEMYQNKDLGRLIIKEYPTGSATITMLRNHIEKLSLKGFKPGLILVDYADIMRSSRSYDSLRHELKLVYEELRNLSMELEIPVWTASQANRDSANSDIVGLENMAEAYGKAMVADVVISISRKAAEKSTGVGRLYIAKNRAGRDGILFPISIDTATSTFSILDENSLTLNEAVEQTASEAKAALMKAWNEVKNDERGKE